MDSKGERAVFLYTPDICTDYIFKCLSIYSSTISCQATLPDNIYALVLFHNIYTDLYSIVMYLTENKEQVFYLYVDTVGYDYMRKQ